MFQTLVFFPRRCRNVRTTFVYINLDYVKFSIQNKPQKLIEFLPYINMYVCMEVDEQILKILVRHVSVNK